MPTFHIIKNPNPFTMVPNKLIDYWLPILSHEAFKIALMVYRLPEEHANKIQTYCGLNDEEFISGINDLQKHNLAKYDPPCLSFYFENSEK